MNFVPHFNFYGVDAKQIPSITGEGAPTTATEGAVGCLYMDTLTGDIYKCTSVADGVYTWKAFGSGGNASDEITKFFDINECLNLFDKSAPREPNFVLGNGYENVTVDYENYTLPVELGKTYTFPIYYSYAGASQYKYVAAYDSNHQHYTKLEGIADRNNTYLTVTITDENIAFVKINVNIHPDKTFNVDNFMITEGEDYPTEYVPFGTYAIKLKSIVEIDTSKIPEIVQETGDSKTAVMSQKATTNSITAESGKYFEQIKGTNLFDKNAPREANIILGSGYTQTNSYFENYSLPVELGKTYTFPIYYLQVGTTQSKRIAAYDTEGNYYGAVEGEMSEDNELLTITITDENIAFVKINVHLDPNKTFNVDNFMITEGAKYPSTYVPYSPFSPKLKKDVDISEHVGELIAQKGITVTKRDAYATGKASIGAKTMNISATAGHLSTFSGWYIPIMKSKLPKFTIGINVCLVSNVSEINVAVELYDSDRNYIKELASETVILAENPYAEGGYSLEHTFECGFDVDSIETEAAYIKVYLPNVSASSTERLRMGRLSTARTDIDSSVYPLCYDTVDYPNRWASNDTDFTFIKLIKPALETVDYKEYGLPVLSVEGDIETMTKDRKVTLDYQYAGRKGTCTLKWQGTSSVNHPKKNYTIVFDTAFEAKEGWGEQKKYCLKANYIDFTHARNICCAKLWGDVVKSRTPANATLNALPNAGAIDGFPICVVINGIYQGIYTFNIPKDGWMFGMGSGTKEAILCAENHAERSTFKAEALLDESDWSIEYQSDEFTNDEIKTSFNRLVRACINTDGTDLDTTIAQYLDWESAIDYYALCLATLNYDGLRKNCLMVTYDGTKWFFSAYDMDSTFGMWWDGTKFIGVRTYGVALCASEHRVFELIKTYKADKLKARYKELISGALSEEAVVQTFTDFIGSIPKALLDEEVKIWNQLPSTSTNNISQIIDFNRRRRAFIDPQVNEL